MNVSNNNNRRDAIGKMLLAMAGVSLLPFTSVASTENEMALNHMNDEKLQPFYVAPSEPLQPGPGGLDIRTLVHSSQTNKQFSCVEFAVAAKKMGPAPHYHKELDELMYVLEGTATVIVEDKVYEIPAGGWHFRPRNQLHTFFNNTDKTFRGIDMYFNQNFEDYLEEMFHQIIPEMQKQKLTPKDPAIAKRMHDLHEKFGLVGFPEKRQAIIDKYGLTA
jgi:quercetin dioxygenase-like cupin family protein